MEKAVVFTNSNELKRLELQDLLLSDYESAVFDSLLSGRKGLNILDLGCNNGQKTLNRFSKNNILNVIGIEYNDSLVKEAKAKYRNERYSFCQMDVESPSFISDLGKIMDERKIKGFDFIYLSFVLMHLNDPMNLLRRIFPLLNKDGALVIIEGHDEISYLKNGDAKLFHEFLEILNNDPYAGKRNLGAILPNSLKEIGYKNVKTCREGIMAKNDEILKKEAIFSMFFTFLGSDIDILVEESPTNQTYKSWKEWLNNNLDVLKESIINRKSEIFMGLSLITASKGDNHE